MSSTDSRFTAGYWQWLTTCDQDLNTLRTTAEFVDFLDRYFPDAVGPWLDRPKQLLQLVVSDHIIGLLRDYAALRADFFSQHGKNPGAPVVAEELRREAEVRALAADYALDHRDWRRRLSLIEEAERRQAASAQRRPHRLPWFSDDPLSEKIPSRRQRLENERFVGAAHQENQLDEPQRQRELEADFRADVERGTPWRPT